jgi:hypothetical protein
MQTRARDSLASGQEALLLLAQELREISSAESSLHRLTELKGAIIDSSAADDVPPATLALLLPIVICLLRGNPTSASASDADLRSAISVQAGEVLDRLVSQDGRGHKLALTPGLVSPLIKALRDAPNLGSRITAARVLTMIAEGQATQRRALARAGVMGLTLACLNEVEDWVQNRDKLGPVWDLARVLLRSEPIAVRDLQRVICGPQADLAFIALVALQVCAGHHLEARLTLLPFSCAILSDGSRRWLQGRIA